MLLSICQGPCLGNGAAHHGLDHPMSINNQDNPPQTCPFINLIKTVAEMTLFFSQVILSCGKLIFKSIHHIQTVCFLWLLDVAPLITVIFVFICFLKFIK